MAGKKERQRKLARERHARQAARRAQRSHKMRIRAIATGGVCALAAVGVGAYFLVGTGGGKSAAASRRRATPTPSPSATASAAATVAEPAHHCTYTTSGTAARKVSLPPSSPNYTASYQATIVTNRGTIDINLLNSKATCTVNSFVHLAEQKYFNNTKCHRLTTDEYLRAPVRRSDRHRNRGPRVRVRQREPEGRDVPGRAPWPWPTPGSRTATAASSSWSTRTRRCRASYTPFGTITQGLPILDAIAKAGSDNSNGSGDGHPKENVVIDSVTIKQT